MEIFLRDDANPEEIGSAAEQIVTSLYGTKTNSLSSCRFQLFLRLSKNSKFSLAQLPPTADAAKQHSLRTYHQLQQWKQNILNPLDWGWKKSKNGLIPVRTVNPPAPQTLLEQIACECTKGCKTNCGYRKFSISCSIFCPCELNDLRPISLLPVLSKILEKVVYLQIEKYLSTHNLLPEYQSGFRAGHSTTTALTNISDDILRELDRKLAVALVLLDYSKAFDSVHHSLLIAKLRFCGFSNKPIKFFKFYLSERTQSVQTNMGVSSSEFVSSGVPQGSVLGPLLFIIYCIDISSHLNHLRIQSYADDIQLRLSFDSSDVHTALQLINDDLTSLNSYSLNHNLNLNPAKCAAIIFCPRNQYDHVTTHLCIQIQNNTISLVEEAKCLGVIFDHKLTFTTYISTLIKKSYVALKLLYANKHILNFKTRKKLCETTVLPIL